MGLFFPIDSVHHLQWLPIEDTERPMLSHFVRDWICPGCRAAGEHPMILHVDSHTDSVKFTCTGCGTKYRVDVIVLQQVPIEHAPMLPYYLDEDEIGEGVAPTEGT